MSNVVSKIGNIIGKSINTYHNNILKPRLDDLKFKEEYQGRIIDCMLGEVDDNYITTPETDAPIVKLEYSREGLIKVPTIKGKTILVDEDGNETDTPAEGCRLVSVGESEDNKLIILSNNNTLKIYSYNQSTDMYGIGNVYTGKLKNNSTKKIILSTAMNGAYKRNIGVQGGELFDFSTLEKGEHVNFLYGNSDFTPKNFLSFIVHNPNEPKQHKTEILLNEPLRSLPNGVKDEIIGNKVIRNTKKVVLNGSEHWDKRQGSANIISYCFECKLGTMGISQYSTPCVSNNLPTNVGAWKDVEHIWLNEWGSATVHISAEKIGEYDIDKFKEWLSNNPIELIYQIEPIIEELPNGITLQGFDDTTMYIENSITPTVTYGYNALIPYKEELSQQKEEVETNTLDIENNIIPYLMDMEFNLMNMEDK